MTKSILAVCFGLAAMALSTAPHAEEQRASPATASVDSARHVMRAGIMSGLSGTILVPVPRLAAEDPERNVINAGLRSGQTGSRIPADRRFRVKGPDDPVRHVLGSGIMTARPDDFASAR